MWLLHQLRKTFPEQVSKLLSKENVLDVSVRSEDVTKLIQAAAAAFATRDEAPKSAQEVATLAIASSFAPPKAVGVYFTTTISVQTALEYSRMFDRAVHRLETTTLQKLAMLLHSQLRMSTYPFVVRPFSYYSFGLLSTFKRKLLLDLGLEDDGKDAHKKKDAKNKQLLESVRKFLIHGHAASLLVLNLAKLANTISSARTTAKTNMYMANKEVTDETTILDEIQDLLGVRADTQKDAFDKRRSSSTRVSLHLLHLSVLFFPLLVGTLIRAASVPDNIGTKVLEDIYPATMEKNKRNAVVYAGTQPMDLEALMKSNGFMELAEIIANDFGLSQVFQVDEKGETRTEHGVPVPTDTFAAILQEMQNPEDDCKLYANPYYGNKPAVFNAWFALFDYVYT